MFQKRVRNQYLTAFCVNIIAISYGGIIGWPSPNLPILQSTNNYTIITGPLTIDESSWIVAILCIGALIGSFLFGYLLNLFGRKISLILLSPPQFLSWLLILCNQNMYYLLLSRFLGGISGGGMFVVIPLYILEISDAKIRGSLGSLMILFCNFGIVLMFIAGNYLTYFTIPKIMLLLPALYLSFIVFLPETPIYLMKINKIKEAEKSWRYFHNVKEDSDSDLSDVKTEMENLVEVKSDDDVKVEWKDFTNPLAIKGLLIGIGLVVLSQFSGSLALLNYASTIFKESGSNLSPNIASIIVATIQLLGTYTSTILMDNIGRKILLLISSLGGGFGLLVMGSHRYLKLNDYNVTNYSWIPITSFSFITFILACGVICLPFVVVSEVMPEKIRSSATTFCMSLMAFCAFISIKYFSIIAKEIEMFGVLFILSGCCFLGSIFIYFIVPETKGKILYKQQNVEL